MSDKDKAVALLRSIVADVRGMQLPQDSHNPIYEMGFGHGETNDHDPRDFFGAFESYYDDGEATGEAPGLCSGGSGVSIEWPNLRILVEQAEELLKRLNNFPDLPEGPGARHGII